MVSLCLLFSRQPREVFKDSMLAAPLQLCLQALHALQFARVPSHSTPQDCAP